MFSKGLRQCDTVNNNFPIDTACLQIVSLLQEDKLDLYWQSKECLNCNLVFEDRIASNSNASFYIDTAYPSKIELLAKNSSCSFDVHLIEKGQYFLTVNETFEQPEEEGHFLKCILTEGNVPDPIDTYLPLIYSVLTFLTIALFWNIILHLKRRGVFARLVHRNSQEFIVNGGNLEVIGNVSQEISSGQNAVPPQKERLKSLDTFRGLAIVLMIFVNYGSGKYFFFDHLPWNGLSPADLIFPWFIWIMGVSLAISMRSISKKEPKKLKIFLKILKRSLILFALGIILNTSYRANDLNRLRIPGVLQRFSISYLVVATLHMFCGKQTDSHATGFWWSKLRDVFLYWKEWIFMFSVIFLHLVLTFALNVPGCPKGYLGPGGLHNQGKYVNCTGGAAGYIDIIILGENHLYGKPTCHIMYVTNMPFDPEGILGSLTSIFLVFLGLQAGKILLTYKCWKERLIRWLIWALITGTIAAILCKASKNEGWIPVNKNLWSLSYVLTTASFAFLLLSFFYFIQDVRKCWTGTPFFYPGMNSILLYVGHQLSSSLFPWYWTGEESHSVQLGMDIWGTALWVIISYALYRKKIFLAL